MYVRFEGNCPGNVSKAAKYNIRSENGGFVVGVVLETRNGEKWHMTTDKHKVLVDMVNRAKKGRGGPFYINEYRQVIVPVFANEETEYYFVGEYNKGLVFEFEGKQISGEAKDVEGSVLSCGDAWEGPRPGIPYILCAGGKDIKYELSLRPNVKKLVKLSQEIGSDRAQKVASKLMKIKGHQGGRFYVNEYLSMFTPKHGRETGVDYVYCGQLDLDEWFPKPHVDNPSIQEGTYGTSA